MKRGPRRMTSPQSVNILNAAQEAGLAFKNRFYPDEEISRENEASILASFAFGLRGLPVTSSAPPAPPSEKEDKRKREDPEREGGRKRPRK